MEIIIDKKKFAEVLSRAKNVVSKKTNLLITTAILLVARNNKLTISATDLDTYYQDSFSANIIQPGEIVIPFKVLNNFISKINESENLHLISEDNLWLKISGSKIKFNIICLNPDDFPILPELDLQNSQREIEIWAEDLKEMIRKTLIISADSIEKNRSHVNGVYFEAVKQNKQSFIRMVSTNGSSLILIDKEFSDIEKLKLNKGILIPKKGLLKLSKILLQDNTKTSGLEIITTNKIVLTINKDYLIAKKQNSIVIIRLLEGTFPDYYDMILKRDNPNITINKNTLLQAIKQVTIIKDNNYSGITIKIEKNIFKLLFINPDIGEIEKTINIDEYIDEPIEISFNSNLITDLLGILDSNNIQLNIKDEKTPLIISGDQDKGTLGLIMGLEKGKQ
jgi:DNA polymerase-3 subunit beta